MRKRKYEIGLYDKGRRRERQRERESKRETKKE
jgi:hypothetical protein